MDIVFILALDEVDACSAEEAVIGALLKKGSTRAYPTDSMH